MIRLILLTLAAGAIVAAEAELPARRAPLTEARNRDSVLPLFGGGLFSPWVFPAGGAWPESHAPVSTAQNETLAIIVNKSNAVSDISLADLRRVFLLEKHTWPNGKKVTVVMRNQGQTERREALRRIYRMTEADYNKYFLQAQNTGASVSPPKTVESADKVRKFVFSVPGAIGYVRAAEVDDTVKLLRIDGLGPADPGYRLGK
ncbi:MAG: hypothetical protein ACKV2V_13125 [Blastocatellia bacterium]